MQTIEKLSNIQSELLKLYANDVPEEDLLEIKELLSDYFVHKLNENFDKFYTEKKLSPIDLKEWAFEHNRKIND